MLRHYPLFSGYVFVMTALVVTALFLQLWTSARVIVPYFAWIRLVNLLMLVGVTGEVYCDIYGPKLSLPDSAWRQAHVLTYLSFLTALIVTSADIYFSNSSQSWLEASIKFVALFLCTALISLGNYARKLGIISYPSRERMIAFGLLFYASAECLYSFMPAKWQVKAPLAVAYAVALLVWIAALVLHRYEPPPPVHPDIDKEIMELASIFLKETREFLDREERQRRLEK